MPSELWLYDGLVGFGWWCPPAPFFVSCRIAFFCISNWCTRGRVSATSSASRQSFGSCSASSHAFTMTSVSTTKRSSELRFGLKFPDSIQ